MASRPHRFGSRKRPGVVAATAPSGAADAEATPVARVHRSRLAIAMAVTVAAVPILVLDNFPATAEGVDQEPLIVEVSSSDLPTTSVAAVVETTVPVPDTVPALDEVAVTEAPTTVAPAPRAVSAPRPTTTTAPPTTEAPAPSGVYGDPEDPATWDRLAQCESGGNWAANTGNGYYGGLQFSLSTWQHYGGAGYPHQAPRTTQIEIGKRLQAAEGWGAWPSCSEKLGYS